MSRNRETVNAFWLPGIRDWLLTYPQADALKAFLISDNPWSAVK
jgi:hypothetical protein